MQRSTAISVHRRFQSVYGKAWTDALSADVYRHFKDAADDDYLGAVELHLADPERGHYPPTPSDLSQQLVAFHTARVARDNAQSAHRRAADFEADKHHRALMRSEQIQGALEVAAEVRRQLTAKYRLDCRAPVDQAVVMDTLTAAMRLAEENGVPYLTVEQTLPLAEPFAALRETKMDERDRWLRACQAAA